VVVGCVKGGGNHTSTSPVVSDGDNECDGGREAEAAGAYSNGQLALCALVVGRGRK
jgi:hypothetical protein